MYVDYVGLNSPEEIAIQKYYKSLSMMHDIDVHKSATLDKIFSHATYENDKVSIPIDCPTDSGIFSEPDSFKEKFCRKNKNTKKLEILPWVIDIFALYGWEVEKLTDSKLTLRPIESKDVLIRPEHTKKRLELLTMEFRAWFNKEMRYYNQGLDSVISEDAVLEPFSDYDYEAEGTKIDIKLKNIPTKFLSQNGCELKMVIEKYIFNNTKYEPKIYGDNKGTAYVLALVPKE